MSTWRPPTKPLKMKRCQNCKKNVSPIRYNLLQESKQPLLCTYCEELLLQRIAVRNNYMQYLRETPR